jgi:hypothetical protein
MSLSWPYVSESVCGRTGGGSGIRVLHADDASAKWNVVCVGLHPPEDSEGNEEGKGRESEAKCPYQVPFWVPERS